MLLPYGVSFESLKKDEKPTNKDIPGEEEEELELDLPTVRQKRGHHYKRVLLNLIVNNNYYIRSYATQTLLVYARIIKQR